jgi:hypothetical protein
LKYDTEETSIIHDTVAHHQSTNTARSCTSKPAPVNYIINQHNRMLKHKNRRPQWAVPTAKVGVARNTFKILVGKPAGSGHLEDCEDGNKILRCISSKWFIRVGDGWN